MRLRSRGIIALLIGIILFIFYLLSFFSPQLYGEKMKGDYLAMITNNFSAGDLGPSLKALKLWEVSPYNYDFYSKLWFEEGIYHTWSPSSMLYILPFFSLNGDKCIMTWNIFLRILTLVSSLIVPLIFFGVWKITAPDRERSSTGSRWDRALIFITLFLITLAFYPLMRSLRINQIQTLITFLQVLAIYYLVVRRDTASAVTIGLIASIKPHYAVAFIWFALDRKWRPLIAGITACAILLLIGAVVFGPSNTYSYYFKVIPHISGKGYAFYPNQSINGMLNRIFHNGLIVKWEASYSPYHPLITPITFIGSAFFIVLALVMPVVRRVKKWGLGIDERAKRVVSILELSLVFAAVTLASPIAWEHNYGCVLPIGVALLPILLNSGGRRWFKLALFSLSWLSIAFYWEVRQLAETPLNILMSYSFFGGIILISILMWEIVSIFMKREGFLEKFHRL